VGEDVGRDTDNRVRSSIGVTGEGTSLKADLRVIMGALLIFASIRRGFVGRARRPIRVEVLCLM